MRQSINFIVWLILGGVIGWLASLVMRTDKQQGVLLNIVVGVVGALLAGLVLSPLFGISTINQSNFSLGALLISFLGAVVLLAIVNFFQKGTSALKATSARTTASGEAWLALIVAQQSHLDPIRNKSSIYKLFDPGSSGCDAQFDEAA